MAACSCVVWSVRVPRARTRIGVLTPACSAGDPSAHLPGQQQMAKQALHAEGKAVVRSLPVPDKASSDEQKLTCFWNLDDTLVRAFGVDTPSTRTWKYLCRHSWC